MTTMSRGGAGAYLLVLKVVDQPSEAETSAFNRFLVLGSETMTSGKSI